ncbi:hypothetical protein EC9_44140 [Rosistilla ulvae]|uniref:BON domain-containing protein n=1 Tax=Rosistilla ulvae TaxID=1930277 RepID=A0A517M5R7_9BACT|nr:hypothetical protein [Rosistilla ulvae]QDS90207.1 hypothetical protein EC9_44140 [Rosistilla ulvae]
MSFDRWSQENEFLNALATNLVRETHGLIEDLSIDSDRDSAIVYGTVSSYHDVQRAIHATQSFGREQTIFARTRLSFRVCGRTLDLTVPHLGATRRVPTPADSCQRELTLIS